ncbi:hypothetical protein [Apilactobacillus xinyiensis]|uniref:Transposase n=1 Tax=Apilactobacillus xinyiensis TaxID=2841032 RepID=A0ABT0I2E9_9LACO|nr:hypothetical protein [Apilactobacillus xinyiensis]MCK8624897.1 hypothetical protein [Apilactobacillus xinyiensis]MCL0319339.1 hypothetical protein [Apilactobacillus xinyiensis]
MHKTKLKINSHQKDLANEYMVKYIYTKIQMKYPDNSKFNIVNKLIS